MSVKESAIDLARHGFRVFPLAIGASHPPVFDGWKDLATSDVAKVEAWFSGFYRKHNVGVATGHGLMVLDCDCKKGKPGLYSLDDLDMFGLPVSLRVRTPSGGMHVYLRLPDGVGVSNSVDAMPGYPGIDVRGDGGYVVGPGSVIGDEIYEVVG